MLKVVMFTFDGGGTREKLGSMSFRVERATTDLHRCTGIATVTSGVASVDGAVKGGQSPMLPT